MAKVQRIKRASGSEVLLIYLPKGLCEMAGIVRGDELLVEYVRAGELLLSKADLNKALPICFVNNSVVKEPKPLMKEVPCNDS